MPDDLAAALAARNARFRAWRERGVPIEGEWAVDKNGLAIAWLSCARCPELVGNAAVTRGASQLAFREKQIIQLLLDDGCPHLAPLLDKDPPEIRAQIDRLASKPTRGGKRGR
jgi:hypothetical protein